VNGRAGNVPRFGFPMLTEKVRTFPCPNCHEIIDESADKCRFCLTTIDRAQSVASADFQAKVNQACSDASFLRIAAGAMIGFMVLSWFRIFFMFFWGFLAIFVLVPVLLIRWQVKFSRIRTNDPDYRKARMSRTVALSLWVAATFLQFSPLLDAIAYRLDH
jgi:hypothetical protein